MAVSLKEAKASTSSGQKHELGFYYSGEPSSLVLALFVADSTDNHPPSNVTIGGIVPSSLGAFYKKSGEIYRRLDAFYLLLENAPFSGLVNLSCNTEAHHSSCTLAMVSFDGAIQSIPSPVESMEGPITPSQDPLMWKGLSVLFPDGKAMKMWVSNPDPTDFSSGENQYSFLESASNDDLNRFVCNISDGLTSILTVCEF